MDIIITPETPDKSSAAQELPASNANSGNTRIQFSRGNSRSSGLRVPSLRGEDSEAAEDSETEAADAQYSAGSSGRRRVDTHDKLWAEIDILNEVQRISQLTQSDKGFFGKAHSDAVNQLRQTQINLARALSNIDKRMDKYEIHEAGDIDTIKRTLFNPEHFEQVNHNVEQSFIKLQAVGEAMKEAHDRENWDES
ncbi:hypothetical protein CJU90_0345 [Yarrowia sp. C11]|nr:hypothetical protein CKK34_1756 [Yarrowia sp. E02]KAG5372693.1 hypothetical protein CJU90_0345 [Yarrowia sp. C11]